MVQMNGLMKGASPCISSDHHVPQNNIWVWNLVKQVTSEFNLITCQVETNEVMKTTRVVVDVLRMAVILSVRQAKLVFGVCNQSFSTFQISSHLYLSCRQVRTKVLSTQQRLYPYISLNTAMSTPLF